MPYAGRPWPSLAISVEPRAAATPPAPPVYPEPTAAPPAPISSTSPTYDHALAPRVYPKQPELPQLIAIIATTAATPRGISRL